jgi:hypothetical protein
MGLVLDGTFNATEGMLEVVRAGKITPHILNQIQAISDRAIKGNQEPKSTLDEIVDLLPVGLAAPIKKLGASNPLVTILVILAVANSVGFLQTNLTSVYRNLVPTDPQSHPTLEASPQQSARDR